MIVFCLFCFLGFARRIFYPALFTLLYFIILVVSRQAEYTRVILHPVDGTLTEYLNTCVEFEEIYFYILSEKNPYFVLMSKLNFRLVPKIKHQDR
jgi:hypothetical protein